VCAWGTVENSVQQCRAVKSTWGTARIQQVGNWVRSREAGVGWNAAMEHQAGVERPEAGTRTGGQRRGRPPWWIGRVTAA